MDMDLFRGLQRYWGELLAGLRIPEIGRVWAAHSAEVDPVHGMVICPA